MTALGVIARSVATKQSSLLYPALDCSDVPRQAVKRDSSFLPAILLAGLDTVIVQGWGRSLETSVIIL